MLKNITKIHFCGPKVNASGKIATASIAMTAVTTTIPTTTATNSTTNTNVTIAPSSTKAPVLSKRKTTTTTEPNQLTSTEIVSATAAVGYLNGILYLPYDATNKANTNSKSNTNNIAVFITNSDEGDDMYDEEEGEEDNYEADSLASSETLSDNVSVWVDGEKHWVSGVDANTTCRDLIQALLNYQQCQPLRNSNVPNNKNQTTINNSSNDANGNNIINQSILNTKEDEEVKEADVEAQQNEVEAPRRQNATAFDPNEQCRNATYVIVRQHRQCEEFLDGNTKVFDLLPAARDATGRKEQHLHLRRLAHTSHPAHIVAGGAPALVGSLLPTDKDSGMGSPVGSSRSARLRRRKHKSTISWLAQGNTVHPKLSQRGSAANERLMKIILAQDETIHRQLTLLREKELQISKIEEEKHRTRQRELGKNYLLETYLSGLDESGSGANMGDEGKETFNDEQPFSEHADASTTEARTVNKTSAPAKTTKKHQQHQLLLERNSKQHKRTAKHTKTISLVQHETTVNNAKTKTTITDATIKPTPVAGTLASAATSSAVVVAGSQNDLEQQILWMEKLCSINKQLQREEELLLKLHSKIRKHHAKRAYRSKQEVRLQITDLDNNIALQAADMRQNEEGIVTFDKQLQQKLILMERLSRELDSVTDVEQQQKQSALKPVTPVVSTSSSSGQTPEAKATYGTGADLLVAAASADGQQLVLQPTTVTNAVRSDAERLTFVDNRETAASIAARTMITALTATTTVPATLVAAEESSISKYTLHAMQSPQDLLSLQQLIAKPPTMMATGISNMTIPFPAPLTTTTAACTTKAIAATYCQNLNQVSSAAQINRGAVINDAELQLQQLQQLQQQDLNDKIHSLHMKTIKKQMFSPKAIVSSVSSIVGNVSVNAPRLPSPSPPQLALTTTANGRPPPPPQLVFIADALDFSQVGTLV